MKDNELLEPGEGIQLGSMYRLPLVVLSLLFSLFFMSQSIVHAEEITNFIVDIKIHPNSTISVSEKITYDFGELERHGIYRNIPFKYTTKIGSYTADITNVSVTNEHGEPYPYES